MTETIDRKQVTNSQLEDVFNEADDLFYHCEKEGNIDRAVSLLEPYLASVDDPSTLARVHAMLAQARFWRHYYAPEGERLEAAEKGVNLATKALGLDPDNLYANCFAALLMGIHGLEMGVVNSLFYMNKVKACAEKCVEIDESYLEAAPHIVLGDLYRFAPSPPIGCGNKKKSVKHLERARDLAPHSSMARVRLAESYLKVRKKDLARQEAEFVLNNDIKERGPRFAEDMRQWARDILSRC
jgi:tetratricopeptide (TPR) repeat protein